MSFFVPIFNGTHFSSKIKPQVWFLCFKCCLKTNLARISADRTSVLTILQTIYVRKYTFYFPAGNNLGFTISHFTYFFTLHHFAPGARGGRIHLGCRRAKRGEEGGGREGIGRPECPEPSAAGQEQREGPSDRGQRRAVSTTGGKTDSNFELSPKARGRFRQPSTMTFHLVFKRRSFTQTVSRKIQRSPLFTAFYKGNKNPKTLQRVWKGGKIKPTVGSVGITNLRGGLLSPLWHHKRFVI